jgi:hypothetical protein
MDESDEPTPMTQAEVEINELLGLFDVPAFARRGQDLEYTMARIHTRCRRERDEMLEMVRFRLRQWSAATYSPNDWINVFTAPIDRLLSVCDVAPRSRPDRPVSRWRRRAIARDLIVSVIRFNQRWSHFLDELNVDYANRLVDLYNRYYLLEKECCLGSARLAARHFAPKHHLTREALRDCYPLLPIPERA